jgi:hypothetical protein
VSFRLEFGLEPSTNTGKGTVRAASITVILPPIPTPYAKKSATGAVLNGSVTNRPRLTANLEQDFLSIPHPATMRDAALHERWAAPACSIRPPRTDL